MPLTQQLALVPDGVKVSSSELTRETLKKKDSETGQEGA